MTDNKSNLGCTNKLSSVQLKELNDDSIIMQRLNVNDKNIYFNILYYLKYYFLLESNATVYEACSVTSL